MTKTIAITIRITVPSERVTNAKAIVALDLLVSEFEDDLRAAFGDAIEAVKWDEVTAAAPKPEPVPRKPRADRGTTRARKDAAIEAQE